MFMQKAPNINCSLSLEYKKLKIMCQFVSQDDQLGL